MKELLIMAKSLGGGGSEVALIELINALPEELYNIKRHMGGIGMFFWKIIRN